MYGVQHLQSPVIPNIFFNVTKPTLTEPRWISALHNTHTHPHTCISIGQKKCLLNNRIQIRKYPTPESDWALYPTPVCLIFSQSKTVSINSCLCSLDIYCELCVCVCVYACSSHLMQGLRNGSSSGQLLYSRTWCCSVEGLELRVIQTVRIAQVRVETEEKGRRWDRNEKRGRQFAFIV